MIHWSLQSSWREVAPGCCRGEACLTEPERAHLSGLRVPRRREEWLLGRVTAKAVVVRALADLVPGGEAGTAFPLRAIEIDTLATGRPCARLAADAAPLAGIAPGDRLPVAVSISHTEGQALCAAARTAAEDEAHRGLGIDLGRIEPRSNAFLETFFTEEERRFVAEAPGERELRANLVWCVKEAVLKALGLGLTVDTRLVSFRADAGAAASRSWIAPAPSAALLGTWRDCAVACDPGLLAGGPPLRVVWRLFPRFVCALASREPEVRARRGRAALVLREPRGAQAL